MEMWVQEDGKSKCHLVMRWIGDERMQRDPPRKRADFHLVSHHERVWQTTKGGKEDDGCVFTQTTGIPSTTPETNLHTKEKWQDAPVKHPLHAMQVDASSLLARTESGRRSHRGPKLLRVSPRTLHGRRHCTMFYRAGPQTVGTVDTRGRHTRVF